jgi:nodulation protein E
LRVLSREVCRPFSRDRTGLAVGEGAGILVLEAWERAQARGATIIGEIVGFGMSADANDITAPDAEGAGWAIRQALRDARLAPGEIDYINAHGTGTRLNDLTEVAAIRDVFGGHADRLPVSSTKSMIGHTMCAGGALELIVTLLALRDGVLPPTIAFNEPDPACDIDCVPNAARSARIETALCNSFAFGGLNAVIAARRAG